MVVGKEGEYGRRRKGGGWDAKEILGGMKKRVTRFFARYDLFVSVGFLSPPFFLPHLPVLLEALCLSLRCSFIFSLTRFVFMAFRTPCEILHQRLEMERNMGMSRFGNASQGKVLNRRVEIYQTITKFITRT